MEPPTDREAVDLLTAYAGAGAHRRRTGRGTPGGAGARDGLRSRGAGTSRSTAAITQCRRYPVRVRTDRDISDSGFPPGGRAFGGNEVQPIHWYPWLAGAPAAGLAAGLVAWSTTGGSPFAAAVLGSMVGLAVTVLPFRIRSYRRPQPSPVRVGYHGLSVYLAENGRWRAGSYHDLPWPVVSGLTSLAPPTPNGTEAPLRITVTASGRAAAVGVPGPVGELLRSTGTVVLADVVRPDLARAVAHYSDGRCQLTFESRPTTT